MKLYIIVCSPDCPRCGEGSFIFAESLELFGYNHIRVTGYFSFTGDLQEYKRLRNKAKKKILIIPTTSYQYIEEIELEEV